MVEKRRKPRQDPFGMVTIPVPPAAPELYGAGYIKFHNDGKASMLHGITGSGQKLVEIVLDHLPGLISVRKGPFLVHHGGLQLRFPLQKEAIAQRYGP